MALWNPDSCADGRAARAQRTRAALLDAAEQLLATHGSDALTMSAVADRAGVARRTAHLHFATRSDLLTGLYHHLDERNDLAAALSRVTDAPDARSELDQWAGHVAHCHARILAVSRALEAARDRDPECAHLWDTTMARWYDGCRRLARRLEEEGQLRPDVTTDHLADVLWALLSFELLERFEVGRGWTPEQFADFLRRTVVSGYLV